MKQYLKGLVALCAGIAGTAQAAVPASVSTAFTDMSADFTTIFGYAFAVLVTVVATMIAWRYTKKLGSKV